MGIRTPDCRSAADIGQPGPLLPEIVWDSPITWLGAGGVVGQQFERTSKRGVIGTNGVSTGPPGWGSGIKPLPRGSLLRSEIFTASGPISPAVAVPSPELMQAETRDLRCSTVPARLGWLPHRGLPKIPRTATSLRPACPGTICRDHVISCACLHTVKYLVDLMKISPTGFTIAATHQPGGYRASWVTIGPIPCRKGDLHGRSPDLEMRTRFPILS
jgi:hypothetical protein